MNELTSRWTGKGRDGGREEGRQVRYLLKHCVAGYVIECFHMHETHRRTTLTHL